MATLRKFRTLGLIVLVSLIALDFYFWYVVFYGHPDGVPKDYFFDVGKGDGDLIVLPGGTKMMTGAGPSDEVLADLASVLSPYDHYIDLALISYPKPENFNGYNYLLDSGYRFGAFIYNGRDAYPGVKEWSQLLAKIKNEHIPLITLATGNEIVYGTSEIDILSPNGEFAASADLNDTGFVEFINTPEFRTLLGAGVGFNIENYLLRTHANLKADVLYSSGATLVHAAEPQVAVIGDAGIAARLVSSTTARIFTTDRDGTIAIYLKNGKLHFLLYNKGK